MTVTEMQYSFDTLIQTMDDVFKSTERLDTDEVVRFLDTAQRRFFEEKYLTQGTFQGNVELLRRKADDLRALIKRSECLLSIPSTGVTNRILATLPDDFLYYLRSDSKITRTALPVVENEWTTNAEVNYTEISNVTTTSFNIPILRSPAVTLESDYLLVYKDNYTTLEGLEMTYIRQLKVLSLDVSDTTYTTTCELSEYLHSDIVRRAVEMYIVEYKFRLKQQDKQ